MLVMLSGWLDVDRTAEINADDVMSQSARTWARAPRRWQALAAQQEPWGSSLTWPPYVRDSVRERLQRTLQWATSLASTRC